MISSSVKVVSRDHHAQQQTSPFEDMQLFQVEGDTSRPKTNSPQLGQELIQDLEEKEAAPQPQPQPQPLSWQTVEHSVGEALRKLAQGYAEKAREFEARKSHPIIMPAYSSPFEDFGSKTGRSSPQMGIWSGSGRMSGSSRQGSSSIRLVPSSVPLDQIGTRRSPIMSPQPSGHISKEQVFYQE
jgi:hypothetical protein